MTDPFHSTYWDNRGGRHGEKRNISFKQPPQVILLQTLYCSEGWSGLVLHRCSGEGEHATCRILGPEPRRMAELSAEAATCWAQYGHALPTRALPQGSCRAPRLASEPEARSGPRPGTFYFHVITLFHFTLRSALLNICWKGASWPVGHTLFSGSTAYLPPQAFNASRSPHTWCWVGTHFYLPSQGELVSPTSPIKPIHCFSHCFPVSL